VSPRRLLLAALVALPFLTAEDANLHTLRFHYEAPVLPFRLPAAATGMSRLDAERAGATGRVLVSPFTVIVLLAIGPANTRSLTEKTVAGATRAVRSHRSDQPTGWWQATSWPRTQPARLPAPLPVSVRRGPPAVPHSCVGRPRVA
jgi:hypothetical protein